MITAIVLFCKYTEGESIHDCNSYVIISQLRERYPIGRMCDHEDFYNYYGYVTMSQSKCSL